MSLKEPKCWTRRCKWFGGVRSEGVEENERVVCPAFPEGIPREIAYGDNPHDVIQHGQVGFYTFELQTVPIIGDAEKMKKLYE